jgi:phosphopantothenoylcysteine decarboxylase/phosphopantothenate--cysteine ligase
MAAAVADYRAAEAAPRKLKKRDRLTLELVATVDILRSLVADPLRKGVLVIGFAAETDDVENNAKRKLAEKGLDLVVLNDVSRSDIGMGNADNEVTVFDSGGFVSHIGKRSKPGVAAALFDIIEARLP